MNGDVDLAAWPDLALVELADAARTVQARVAEALDLGVDPVELVPVWLRWQRVAAAVEVEHARRREAGIVADAEAVIAGLEAMLAADE